MQYLLISLTIFIFSQTAYAADYETEIVNGYTIVHSKKMSVAVERETSVPATDCRAVAKKMQEERFNIKRCSANGRQPQSFCSLVKESLSRYLGGYINRAMGTQESDVNQIFFVEYASTTLPNNIIDKIARADGLEKEEIVLANTSNPEASYLGYKASETSDTFLLETAPLLGINPEIDVRTVQGGLEIRTGNRLTTCELLAGKIHFNTKAKQVSTYTVINNDIDLDSYWQLFDDLSSAWKDRYLSENRKLVLAGMLLGKFLGESDNPDYSEDDFNKLVKLMFSSLDTNPSLQEFENHYSLGLKLPASEQFTTTLQNVEVRL